MLAKLLWQNDPWKALVGKTEHEKPGKAHAEFRPVADSFRRAFRRYWPMNSNCSSVRDLKSAKTHPAQEFYVNSKTNKEFLYHKLKCSILMFNLEP